MTSRQVAAHGVVVRRTCPLKDASRKQNRCAAPSGAGVPGFKRRISWEECTCARRRNAKVPPRTPTVASARATRRRRMMQPGQRHHALTRPMTRARCVMVRMTGPVRETCAVSSAPPCRRASPRWASSFPPMRTRRRCAVWRAWQGSARCAVRGGPVCADGNTLPRGRPEISRGGSASARQDGNDGEGESHGQ